jgi:hypothetical protein
MSDPSNQRADGCSVFFTFIVLGCLLSGFYLAQRIFEPETPVPVTDAVDSIRRDKAASHREENANFIRTVDNFHTEQNSSLESSMKKVVQDYQTLFKAKKNHSK